MIDKLKFLSGKRRKGVMGIALSNTHISLVHCINAPEEKPKVTMAHVEQLKLEDDIGLKRLVQQLGLKSYPCNLALNADQYQVLQVDKPNMPEAEIQNALVWKVKGLVDYQVSDATIRGIDLPSDPQQPNRSPFMFAICAKNKLLEDASNRLMDAGFLLKSVDVQVLAQRNIAALLEHENRVIVLVSFSAKGCLITFTANGELYHARFVELDRGYHLGDLITSNLERLGLELQRSLDSFDRQFPYLSVQRVVICPDQNAARFVDDLKNSLYLPVETFNLADIVSLPENMDFSSLEKQSMLVMALGAALRPEESL
jgi:MSHA biogenesis protein MshI